jgi:hypothetical protein
MKNSMTPLSEMKVVSLVVLVSGAGSLMLTKVRAEFTQATPELNLLLSA